MSQKVLIDDDGVPLTVPSAVRKQFARRGHIYWSGAVEKKNRKWKNDKRFCVITRTGVYLIKGGSKITRCLLHQDIVEVVLPSSNAVDEKIVGIKTVETEPDLSVELGVGSGMNMVKSEFLEALMEAYRACTGKTLTPRQLDKATGETKEEFLKMKPPPQWTHKENAGILHEDDHERPTQAMGTADTSQEVGDRLYQDRLQKTEEEQQQLEQQQRVGYPRTPPEDHHSPARSDMSGTVRSVRGLREGLPHNPTHTTPHSIRGAEADPVHEDTYQVMPSVSNLKGRQTQLYPNVNAASLRVNNASLMSPRRLPGSSAGMPTMSEQYAHEGAPRHVSQPLSEPVYRSQAAYGGHGGYGSPQDAYYAQQQQPYPGGAYQAHPPYPDTYGGPHVDHHGVPHHSPHAGVPAHPTSPTYADHYNAGAFGGERPSSRVVIV